MKTEMRFGSCAGALMPVFLFALLFAALSVENGAAQELRGKVSGTVTDSSGAMIPGGRGHADQ